MARDRVKRAPTHYPFVPFHLLRGAQLLSSLVVGSIMFYFVYHLSHDHWKLPWTFIILLTVSLLTILTLTMTITLHCCCGLNPRLNVALNSCLCLLWAVGFALLSWWSSGTLSHVCNRANWHDETGIMVCRIYKALFAFAMVGFVSTLAALLLDVYVFKRATVRGKYNQMEDLDNKGVMPGYNQSERLYNDSESHDALGSAVNLAPQKPFGAQVSSKAPHQRGYEMPAEQFAYDTGYQGGHEAHER